MHRNIVVKIDLKNNSYRSCNARISGTVAVIPNGTRQQDVYVKLPFSRYYPVNVVKFKKEVAKMEYDGCYNDPLGFFDRAVTDLQVRLRQQDESLTNWLSRDEGPDSHPADGC